MSIRIRNTTDEYGGVARFLHWTIAAMVVAQFVLGELSQIAGYREALALQSGLLGVHKSIGTTVLAFALIRLGWRVSNPRPTLPSQMPGWQRLASAVSHWAMYVLILLIPLFGWLMSSALAETVMWFNLFALPDLVGANEELAQRFEDIHVLLGTLLLWLAMLHVAAAVKHHLLDGDRTLVRMISISSLGMFALILIVALWMVGSIQM